MFQRTTAVNKILNLKKKIKVIKGGTSAGKTIAILSVLIDKALKIPNLEISVVAESIPHLKRGARKDFIKLLKQTNRFNRSEWNLSNSTYYFNNGSSVEFFSADKDEKLRGARRDILYINECNNVKFEAYVELLIRTKKEIYLDYNPVSEFWVDTELTKDKDAEFLTLTFKDNEACPKESLKEILKNKEKAKTSDFWRNWWNVYGLGQTGKLTGIMFENLNYFDLKETDLSNALFFSFTDSANGGNDYLCSFIVALLGDKLYFIDALYTKKSSNFTFPLLEDLFKRYKTTLNYFEMNSFGSMFYSHFSDKGFICDGFHNTKNKLSRIIASVYYVEKVYFANESSSDYNKALKHIQEFPMDGKAENDDAPDCLELAIFYFRNLYPHLFK